MGFNRNSRGLISVLLLAAVQPTTAQFSLSTNDNFTKDLVIGIVVAAVVTVVLVVILCTVAQCGPRLCGRISSEKWFEPKLEEGQANEEIYVQSGAHMNRYSASSAMMEKAGFERDSIQGHPVTPQDHLQSQASQSYSQPQGSHEYPQATYAYPPANYGHQRGYGANPGSSSGAGRA